MVLVLSDRSQGSQLPPKGRRAKPKRLSSSLATIQVAPRKSGNGCLRTVVLPSWVFIIRTDQQFQHRGSIASVPWQALSSKKWGESLGPRLHASIQTLPVVSGIHLLGGASPNINSRVSDSVLIPPFKVLHAKLKMVVKLGHGLDRG